MAEKSPDNQFLDTPQVNAGLRFRVVRGGFWVFVLRITTWLFGLVRTIILARLLAPADFGVFGIALLAMSALQTFSRTGFGAALVQKKEDTEFYLDTAWTVQVIRGVVLGLIAFALAPYVAAFFDAPAAKPILQVIAFSVLLGGLGNIGLSYFQKELEFHKTFVYELSGTLADIGVAIPAAFILRSVWALVFGLLARTIVQIVLSYFIHPYRPRPRFNWQQFKELFGFGKWILASSIVVFLATQGDDAFLCKILGASALGLYQVAFRFANLPGSEIGVLSRVAFPAYSKLQDNIPKLRDAYLRMMRFVSFLSIPLGGGIFMLGPAFTHIFLGDKWMPMVPALRILAISGIIGVINSPAGSAFNALGKPHLSFVVLLTRVITLAGAIYPLALLWGMSGVAVAVLLSSCSSFPVIVTGLSKVVGLKMRDLLKACSCPLLAVIVMIIGVYVLGNIFDQFQSIWFLISVLFGMLTYLGVVFISQKELDYPISEDIRLILNSLKSKAKA